MKKYRLIPIILICTYWIYEIIKYILLPNRRPESVEQVLFFSLIQAFVAFIAATLLYKAFATKTFFEELRDQFHKKNLILGILYALGSFIVINFIFSPVSQILVQIFHIAPEGTHSINYLFKGDLTPLYWIVISILGGGFAEECIRCLSLKFFNDSFEKKGLYLALSVSSALFGLGHLYQGASGALTNVFTGLLWGYLFIRRRNLVTNITTHAVYDLIGALIACYLYR